MGCDCNCASTLLSQEIGSAYYYVRLVADNIQLLQDLATQMGQTGETIDITRGSTSVIANGVVIADPDNSHIAVTPEAGNADDVTTIDGDPDGRVIVLVPRSEAFTLTIKPQEPKQITVVNPLLNEFTVAGHGLVTGQLIELAEPGLPADVVAGAYYAISTGTNTFKVATTKDNALAGTSIDVVNVGAGVLNVGNIKVDGDLVLTNRQSAMFVKDGNTYTLLGTSGSLPAFATLMESRQPLNALLSNISTLDLAGKAGKFIQVSATADGFQVMDYDLATLTADLATKSAISHDHAINDVAGLEAALVALQPKDDDLSAIAGLATKPFGRSLLTLEDVAALINVLGLGATTVPPGSVPDNAASVTLVDWSDAITMRTASIAGAETYRWRFYLADGVTLRREINTTEPSVKYTSQQAAVDGISRSYKVQVAGVNSNGVGVPKMSTTLNKNAPAAPTGVAFADGTYTSTVTFTPSASSGVAGYMIAYSTTVGFNPMTQGSMFAASASPAYTSNLPAASYYGKIAAYDLWSKQPDQLNFSAEDAFVITAGTGGTSGGSGGGGYNGGGGGGGGVFIS